jgi:hypothetical protein
MYSFALSFLLLPAAHSAERDTVTWCRDVAPIVQGHCQTCHRAGEVGPFTLASYKDARDRAEMIREVVAEGRMPPWGADPAYGHFSNDPSLSPQEKKLLLAWVDAGCPEGDRADLPPPAVFPEGPSIGKPDLVVSMPCEFRVPARGVVEYQNFDVDPGFREDRWVVAAEILRGNRKVVHHCNVFLQPPGTEGVWEQGSLGSYCLAAMAQGTPPMTLPEGMAKRIPAKWKIVFVMHYTPIGIEQTDRTSIALRFADPARVKREVATKLMWEPNLHIPPGDPDYPVKQTWRMQQDVLLLALFPHMHLRGKSFRYEAVYPDGRTEILLDVPRFDFGWQPRYALAEPKRLPAGTLLRSCAVFDNSKANPANPDPSRWVPTGMQTWDEMFNGYFDVAVAEQDLTKPVPWLRRARGLPVALTLLLAVGCFAWIWSRPNGDPKLTEAPAAPAPGESPPAEASPAPGRPIPAVE